MSKYVIIKMEVGIDEKLHFFDTLLIIEEQRLVFDRYRKVIFSDRFLNYYSHHSICHKKGVIWYRGQNLSFVSSSFPAK